MNEQNTLQTSPLNPLVNPFQFTETDVRTAIDLQGNPWFCAKDVCEAIDITWSGATLENMPEEWFTMLNLNTIKGERDAVFISEPGFYFLVFRSNKPKARELVNWVCAEVLPSIRKNGMFGAALTLPQYFEYIKVSGRLLDELAKCKDKYQFAAKYRQLRDLANLAKQPLPNIKLLGMELKQDDLLAFVEGGFFDGEGE